MQVWLIDKVYNTMNWLYVYKKNWFVQLLYSVQCAHLLCTYIPHTQRTSPHHTKQNLVKSKHVNGNFTHRFNFDKTNVNSKIYLFEWMVFLPKLIFQSQKQNSVFLTRWYYILSQQQQKVNFADHNFPVLQCQAKLKIQALFYFFLLRTYHFTVMLQGM